MRELQANAVPPAAAAAAATAAAAAAAANPLGAPGPVPLATTPPPPGSAGVAAPRWLDRPQASLNGRAFLRLGIWQWAMNDVRRPGLIAARTMSVSSNRELHRCWLVLQAAWQPRLALTRVCVPAILLCVQKLDNAGVIAEILGSFRLATEHAPNWAKAWHQWALFNVAVSAHYR